MDLHFGNVSLVGEHGSINSGTRTADALQPVLPEEEEEEEECS